MINDIIAFDINKEMWNDSSLICDESSSYEFVDNLLSNLSIVMLLLAGIALIANSSFLLIICIGVRRGDLPIKRLLLVANRSMADLLTSSISLLYLINAAGSDCLSEHLGCTHRHPQVYPLPLQIGITLDYWAVALSYSGIAILTWYAVKSPLEYKVHLTVHTVIRFILLGWMIMMALLCVIFVFTSDVNNFDSNGMIYVLLHSYKKEEVANWMIDLCDNIRPNEPIRIATLALLLPVMLYLIATLSYMVVTIVLFRRRESQAYRRHFSAVWRLGTHLGIFTITCIIMGLAYYATAPMKQFCKHFEENPHSTSCGSMSPLVSYSLLTALSTAGWFLRMSIDPLIDVLIDGVLRRAIWNSRRHRLSTINSTAQYEVHKMSFCTRYPSNLLDIRHDEISSI